jgi:hypothetical protein
MTINKERWLGAVAVLAVAGLLLGWDYYAKRSGLPRPIKLATTPLGNLVGGDRDRAQRQPPAVNLTAPLTGGAPQTAKSTPVKEPVAEAPVQQQVSSTKTKVVIPSGKAIEGVGTLAAASQESRSPDTVTRKEPELQPTGIGMQRGAIVARGRQAPELRLALTSAGIEELVVSKRAMVEVESSDGHALYFLDRSDGPFRPISEMPVATMSNRYVAIIDLGLVSSWLVRLGQLPSNSYKFGLRFTKTFDETIVERQLASLIEHRIDFNQALARGTKVTTHGSVADGSEIVIDTVSVEELRQSPAE